MATPWLTALGTLYGTSGDDVLVCGNGGHDVLLVAGLSSLADGGTGNDDVEAVAGATALGGAGDDPYVFALGDGSLAAGGSGNDFVEAVLGATADVRRCEGNARP